MRLKHIKLAGFKSFVDPTKVPFEQQMTAIVGPNGCGKSNIIDAVRWVLGESSAKNLRGDAMTDVIFNGASTRKPVGQASVELLFDNVAGKIQGSMADRDQVSIRRVVNRDGQNSYYLNGTKCRRKDITDIFLGTGLGPRSYAIIEQGTISRLIESKPQELRVFIEEAAGISKYKERRRDTELRIRHTRENLARLTDIRLELEQQLDKLHQQAEAAKRFKTLKAQERKTKAELAVLRWQKFAQTSDNKQQQIIAIEQQIAEKNITHKADDVALFSAKQDIIQANEAIGQLQQQKIILTNDIARVEQQLKHSKQQQAKLQADKTHFIEQIRHAQQSLLNEQAQVQSLMVKQEQKVSAFEMLEQQLQSVQQQLTSDNAALVSQQDAWYRAQQQRAKQDQQQQTLRNKHTQLQAKHHHLQSRLVAVSEQFVQLTDKKQQLLHVNDGSHHEQQQVLNGQIDTLEQELQSIAEKLSTEQQSLTILNEQQSEQQGTKKALDKQLEYLEQKLLAKSDWQVAQQQWLASIHLEAEQTLQEKMSVTSGWELAAEVVLSHQLQANCLSALPFSELNGQELPQPLVLLRENPCNDTIVSGSLAEQISGAPTLIPLLNAIKTADSIADALAILPELSANESVISRQGLWLSHTFVRYGVVAQKNDHLKYQQELSEQLAQIAALEITLSKVYQQRSNIEQQLLELTQRQQEISAQSQQKQQALAELKQTISLANQSQQLLDEQLQSVSAEKQQLTLELSETEQDLVAVAKDLALLATASNTAQLSEQDSEQLNHSVQKLQKDVQQHQAKQHSLVQQKHQAELALEKNKHQVQQLEQSITRLQDSMQHLTAQQAKNSEQLQQNVAPLAEDEQQLQVWLTQMSEIDHQLSKQQANLGKLQQGIEQMEQRQRQVVEVISQLKEQLNQLHLDGESHRLKAEAALEQLHELGQELNAVQKNMPEHARESQWQAQLIKLAKDIQLLGAINLAAIDEFETQLARKNYLEQQDQDLNLAITTLESAIEKIDKESRQKFKTTFDSVNQDLQTLFPKVFGGGNAYLSLTDDDLLETGITIMARPPGKKNSTIHLLSGGEKALTALSLVFAIFRLNPAPFCMLDEVDAPLDDANVSRFCKLVEEMSQSVQFIYISHNKIAMEMATHLTGVTMFEAGVSRMVSVDIDEAIAMAEVS